MEINNIEDLKDISKILLIKGNSKSNTKNLTNSKNENSNMNFCDKNMELKDVFDEMDQKDKDFNSEKECKDDSDSESEDYCNNDDKINNKLIIEENRIKLEEVKVKVENENENENDCNKDMLDKRNSLENSNKNINKKQNLFLVAVKGNHFLFLRSKK